MKCIIGLGNIGQQYEKTRHNVGFMAVDAFAEREALTWTAKSKLNAEIALDNDTLLVKPTTFMNLSGNAVQAIKQFYKIDNSDILVICDDIDRNFGELRIRQSGGDGGHNGLKDLIAHIGEDFWRLRIGVANEYRGINDAADFVLSNFTKDELATISSSTTRYFLILDSFIDGSIESHSASLAK
jgi:PTH1 family peptidyl-tRNA hydrolase